MGQVEFKQLVNELKKLKKSGVVGIKQSFEDEGVLVDDVVKMKRICGSLGVFINVKIGGCEAISDINNCLLLGVDGIVTVSNTHMTLPTKA